jgi:hypothetical protein
MRPDSNPFRRHRGTDMNKRPIRPALIALGVALLAQSALGKDTRGPAWAKSMAEAEREARERNAPFLIYVGKTG